MAERVAAARPGNAIRISDVIEGIIPHDNLELPFLAPAHMPEPPTLQRAGPSGLKAHLPPFRCRVDSSDKEEPERPVWPPRRLYMECKNGDYEQDEDVISKLARYRKRARRRANPFIDAEAGVDGDASGDEWSDEEIDDLDGFIVADDVEY